MIEQVDVKSHETIFVVTIGGFPSFATTDEVKALREALKSESWYLYVFVDGIQFSYEDWVKKHEESR